MGSLTQVQGLQADSKCRLLNTGEKVSQIHPATAKHLYYLSRFESLP